LTAGLVGIHKPLILHIGLIGMAFAAVTSHARVQGLSVGNEGYHSPTSRLLESTDSTKEGLPNKIDLRI
jgi:hypothetical protein